MLVLFSCNKAKDKTVSKKDSIRAEIDKAVKEFTYNSVYPVLTKGIIDRTTDNELLMRVYGNIETKLPEGKNKHEAIQRLTKGQQAIFALWDLQAYIHRGGFNDYYANTDDSSYAAMLPDALQRVGAVQLATVMKKANKVYQENKERITRYQDGTLKGFEKSYKKNPLNPLDKKFQELYETENLQQLQIAYIRKHKEEFVDG